MFIIYLTIKFLWVQCKITSYQIFYVEKKINLLFIFKSSDKKKTNITFKFGHSSLFKIQINLNIFISQTKR